MTLLVARVTPVSGVPPAELLSPGRPMHPALAAQCNLARTIPKRRIATVAMPQPGGRSSGSGQLSAAFPSQSGTVAMHAERFDVHHSGASASE